MRMDCRERSTIKVLMFPWLAYGHISPFLELAKRLASRNFDVYFCSTPVNLTSIIPKLDDSISIKLVELQLPLSFPDELPPHYHTTKGLPPHLMPILMKAVDMATPNFSNILNSLQPHLLIYDFLPSWASGLASSMNIPAIALLTNGAAMNSFVLHEIRNKDNGLEFPFPQLLLPVEYMKPKSSPLRESFLSRQGKDWLLNYFERSNNVILIKSLRELEGKYMDYISSSLGKKVVPVGPLVEEVVQYCRDENYMDIMKWLDKKEKHSTIFVSFGSEIYFSKEEMEEMAHGLELSEANFIWVVRFPQGEKMKLEEALPEGFQKRVRERGMVVENWAPQVEILGHSSIGGFVSHCGWGSLMESMKLGVPIIAMPMQFDQPWNARLVEEFGVGLGVKKHEDEIIIESEMMAKVIKQVVVEKSGEDIRKKARVMGEIIRNKGDIDMDEVVKEIVQLCGM
ncbi:hypothetical protein FNV43_RR25553 [Rhamnella rubrinervis]|uniref:Glycosyltransferase n=1 Tax=Rhamnella rubrinervis TaxID=2594499 RepID=A0A8K0DNT0_9ROSA|nr:hypothetical protein FNV43_RR25553 [Rhamnella rubrinervis]